MNFKKYIILIITSLLLIQCEEIGVIESDIPFEEIYIINGHIVGDTKEIEVTISKSFEIQNNYDIKDVVLDSLTTYIWSENQGIWPLALNDSGKYVPIDDVAILPSTHYELYVKIGGKRIYSTTFVPQIPDIKETWIDDNFIVCKLLPSINSVYGCKYRLFSVDDNYREIYSEETFFDLSEETENITEPIEIRTNILPEEYFNNPEKYWLLLTVYAFDNNYKKYYETRENNKPIENIFSEGGGSVYWNVEGENTIGMFVGYTKKEITIFN